MSVRHRFRIGRYDHGMPIRSIGFAPFASLFSVCSVFFWAAFIPLPTHAVTIVLSPECGSEPDSDPASLTRVSITPTGTIYWNEGIVTEAALLERLERELANIDPKPIVFTPHPDAKYETSLRALAKIEATGAADIDPFCFGDTHLYASFGKTDVAPFNLN